MSDNKIVIGTLSIIASGFGRIWKPAFRSGERDSLLCAGRVTCAPVSRNKPISSFSLSIRLLYLVGPYREVNALAGSRIDSAGTRQMLLEPSKMKRKGTSSFYTLWNRALSIFIQCKTSSNEYNRHEKLNTFPYGAQVAAKMLSGLSKIGRAHV